MQNNFQSFTKFKKIQILVSLIFLIFSCCVFFFLYKKIDDNKKTSEKIQTDWQIEAARRDEIRSLDQSIRAIEKEKNLLESHFAQNSNIVPFLDTIEQLAFKVKAGSEITSVDISKEKKGLSVAVKATGSFESIYKFLMLLENSPYELEFISANIQKSSTQSSWDAVFKIQLLSFVQ